MKKSRIFVMYDNEEPFYYMTEIEKEKCGGYPSTEEIEYDRNYDYDYKQFIY